MFLSNPGAGSVHGRVQCCSEIDTWPALSRAFSLWLVLGVVFIYVVFKEFGSCCFSNLFMFYILNLVYVVLMFPICNYGILTTAKTKRETQNPHWPTHPPIKSPSIMLMIRWKRCESQSVISINIRPRTYEVCFDLTKMEGYTLQMLDCLSLHSNSGTNGMLGYSDKSIEKHGKNKKKILRKIGLETSNLNYPIAIHTWTIYGKKMLKILLFEGFLHFESTVSHEK